MTMTITMTPLQYMANSPGFGYQGDSQWFIESSAQWYMANYFSEERDTYNWVSSDQRSSRDLAERSRRDPAEI